MTWHSVVLASAPQRQLLKMSAHSENRYYYKKGSSKKQPEDRLFDKKQKEQCWAQSPKVPGMHVAVFMTNFFFFFDWLHFLENKGRDPERWRIDAAGNIVLRKLTGCMGCLCYGKIVQYYCTIVKHLLFVIDYDHIVPYSKGGKTEVPNCQILVRYLQN